MSIERLDRGVVDAFEDGWARVIVGEPGRETAHLVLRSRLPEDTRVGDVLRVRRPHNVPVDQAMFEFDAQDTVETRERVRGKLDRLRQRG
ncbi:DUF3006 domain-containing protein [Thioalkalivibrio sp. ALE23]|uniref:DUF3006 domain-containing protein n=1 Tax=Thioalkalivibrio sp. ALE23 TaxID=1265495 RepID=UPI001E4B1CD7|nr:DUF3006 domain-containing protein [Thioalkalivibrio sp. ALE23]